RRASKFVRGLKGYIRSRIMSQNHQTIASAVTAACLQETEQEMFLSEQKRLPQRFGSASSSRPDRKRKIGSSSVALPPAVQHAPAPVAPAVVQRVEQPACQRGGKLHGGLPRFRGSGRGVLVRPTARLHLPPPP